VTFTYSNTSISTDLAKTRLRIGDTVDRGDKSLTDEEIQVVLDDFSNLDTAALRCAELLLARMRKYHDRSQSGVDESQSQEIEHLEKVIDMLQKRVSKGGVSCYSGMISQDRLDDAADDSDYPQPSFAVGMDDKEGAGNESDLVNGDD
jgi:hypothetical protein